MNVSPTTIVLTIVTVTGPPLSVFQCVRLASVAVSLLVRPSITTLCAVVLKDTPAILARNATNVIRFIDKIIISVNNNDFNP